ALEHRPNPLRMTLPVVGVVRRFLAHDRTMTEFEAGWEKVIEPRRGRDWSAVDPLARVEEFHAVWRAAADLWGVTLINDSILGTYTGLTHRLLNRWLPDGSVLLSDLLCGGEDNHSAAIIRSTVELAERVRARPELLAAVDAEPVELVWTRLDAGGYGADLREAFARHLHRYGDRGLEELKMERPNLRRTPWE